ncbi:MAG: universal stress protein [Hamadaea sp.]|uniref:universal stress protein n=1 Tax=Hamadaea sp. TaxID=2024425 RepID=UPI0017D6F150|nr:universal stress protein [Hamadaea sp.]NUT18888.1 universal stress protein [Hamadaea sp.]
MTSTYRIVVGVDGSPASVAALRWAFRQAYARRGSVLAVCVWPWDPRREVTHAEATHAQCEALLSEAITVALADNPRVPVSGRVVVGRAAYELVKVARVADLLVLGSHGRGRVSRAMLGSVTEACVRLSTVPVVVLPHRAPVPATQPARALTAATV